MKRLDQDQCRTLLDQLKTSPKVLSVTHHISKKVAGDQSEDIFVDQWPSWSAILVKVSEDPIEAMKIPTEVRSFVTLYGTDFDALSALLEEAGLNWKKYISFQGMPTEYLPRLEILAAKHQGSLQVSMDGIAMACDPEVIKNFDAPPLPEDLIEGTLSVDDIEILNQNVKPKYGRPSDERAEHGKYLITSFPTVSLRNHKGELVGYEGVKFNGGMGMLHTNEEYRGRGLAKYLIKKLAIKMLEEGMPLYCFIEKDNNVSISLHQKCGFYVAEGSDAIWAKYWPTEN